MNDDPLSSRTTDQGASSPATTSVGSAPAVDGDAGGVGGRGDGGRAGVAVDRGGSAACRQRATAPTGEVGRARRERQGHHGGEGEGARSACRAPAALGLRGDRGVGVGAGHGAPPRSLPTDKSTRLRSRSTRSSPARRSVSSGACFVETCARTDTSLRGRGGAGGRGRGGAARVRRARPAPHGAASPGPRGSAGRPRRCRVLTTIGASRLTVVPPSTRGRDDEQQRVVGRPAARAGRLLVADHDGRVVGQVHGRVEHEQAHVGLAAAQGEEAGGAVDPVELRSRRAARVRTEG